MKKIARNKDCKECPQNRREDVVWKKGYQDGWEAVQQNFKKIFWKFCWRKY